MFLEISYKIHKENTCVRVSFLKYIKKETLAQLFSCEFCKISKNTFFTEHLLQSWRLLLLFIDLSHSHLPSTSLYLVTGNLYSVCLFYNLAIFYDSCSYLSSFLFLITKIEFVSSFVLSSPFSSGCRLLFDCVIDLIVRDIILEAILSPSESYPNIQYNPEYDSILPFRIILKTFARPEYVGYLYCLIVDLASGTKITGPYQPLYLKHDHINCVFKETALLYIYVNRNCMCRWWRESLLLVCSTRCRTDDFQSFIIKLCKFKQRALWHNIYSSGA